MNWSRCIYVVVWQVVVTFQTASGSEVSVGVNGINSSVLSLTGEGISIGQVEPGRPGLMGFDPNSNIHTAVTHTRRTASQRCHGIV